MLRKSLKSLVESNQLNSGSNFEIIHDQSAIGLSGGLQECPKLEKCNEFVGSCPNLVTCGTFD